MGKRQTLNDLVFEALGSSFNRKDFVLFEKELNSYKERLWSGSQPMSKVDFGGVLDAAISGALPSTYYLSALRSVSQSSDCITVLTISDSGRFQLPRAPYHRITDEECRLQCQDGAGQC